METNAAAIRPSIKTVVHSLFYVLILFNISGCIFVTDATPEVMHSDKVVIEDNSVLSLADRRMIEYLSKTIRQKQNNIEVVDGLSFRDTVFPEGGWELQDLLAHGEESNLSEETNVDYLIVISPYTEVEQKGVFVFGAPFMIGYHSGTERFSVSAKLIDMESLDVIDQIISKGEGEGMWAGFFWWVVYGEKVVQPALDTLADEIVQVVTKLKKSEKSRIVIMSLEKPIDLSKENKNRVFPYRHVIREGDTFIERE